MAGGIFTPYEFHPNLKCIVISLLLAFGYWVTPKQNLIVLVLILIITYIAISWYDYLYDCTPMLAGSGGFSYQSIFKPQYRDLNRANVIPNQEYTYLKTVYMFHLFMVVPLLLQCALVGYAETTSSKKIKGLPGYSIISSPSTFVLLGSTGIIAGAYHGMRLFVPRLL